ncbi:MAG: hypothetical protein ACHBN1_28410 [Heteroscytonema crispum UTEX LB 1556]
MVRQCGGRVPRHKATGEARRAFVKSLIFQTLIECEWLTYFRLSVLG